MLESAEPYYHEAPENSLSAKKRYLASVEQFIANRQTDAQRMRDQYIDPQKLFADPEKYRREFLALIGVPEPQETHKPTGSCELLATDTLCSIYRVCIRTMPGFDFFGILELPHNVSGKFPLVIAQHGGGGTPEYCLDMYGSNSYCHFGRRALEKGMAVFAPQLLLWQCGIDTGELRPRFDLPYNRDKFDRQLKQCGLSIMGLEIFNIMRSIDYFSTLAYIDSQRIGMMGLSYGGFFSLYTAAADTRIKSIYCAAAFNDRSAVALSDWMWKDQSNFFHDAEVVGLCAPRNLVIDVGRTDSVFDFRPASAEAERAALYYRHADAESNFRFHLWDGGHTFYTDGDGFDVFFSALEARKEQDL